jgi:hypothetical protein
MKVYTNTKAIGVYPVGFAAVVVATSKKSAASMLRQKMEAYHLDPTSVKAQDFVELSTETPHAIILNDGNY